MGKLVQLIDNLKQKYYTVPYYPVGSVFITSNNTNPSKWFGGTWELFGSGKTLVGVDTSQTEFNTVLKSGGSKTHIHTQGNTGAHTLTVDEMPSHNHNIEYGTNINSPGMNVTVMASGSYTSLAPIKATGGGKGHSHTNPNTNSSSNLMPYITVYFWRKTAM